MIVEPSEVASAPLTDPGDLVCIGTTSDRAQFRLWTAALVSAGITARTQTISVREPDVEPRDVYLLYVPASDEDVAMQLVQPHRDLPIFPLAHLRLASW